jgi:hypothetical protein
MNTATRRWTYRFIGACTGFAGLVLLIATISAPGPVGYSVGVVIGSGFAFGLLACALKEAVARLSLRRFADGRRARLADNAVPAIAGTPVLVDLRAAPFVAVKRSGVASVTSLTEVHALRRRAARRPSGSARRAPAPR